MKIISIRIKNYKCFKDVKIEKCSNFHTFIGRNSSGKTSILEIIEIIKNFPNEVTNIADKVYGGVSESEEKDIILELLLLLSFDERKRYFNGYLHLPDELIEGPEATKILNRVKLVFTITVRRSSSEVSDNHVLLTEMAISNTGDTKLVSILNMKEAKKKILNLSEFAPGLGPNIHNNPYVDEHLEKLTFTSNSALGFFNSKPTGDLRYDFLQDLINQLEVIHSIRGSEKVVESKFIQPSDVDKHGQKLVGLMLSMYHRRNEEFKAIEDLCKRIFPELEEIRPYQLENGQFTMLVIKKNLPVTYGVDLREEGIGIEQAFIIIWKIATSIGPRIWLLDEPELHLHPGAQKLLYDFLRDQGQNSTQILIASQSMVFVHKSKLEEVSIIFDDENDRQLISLEGLVSAEEQNTEEGIDQIRNRLYDALGYDIAFAFEPKTVVFVEGIADELILTSFSRILGNEVNKRATRFVPLGDKSRIERYSPVLAFSLFGKKCLILVDNDKKDPNEIMTKVITMEKSYKDKVNHKPVFTEKNFCLYPSYVYSIEFYLIEMEAICKAAGKTDAKTMAEIEIQINKSMPEIMAKTLKPKDLLSKMWESDLKCGPYHEVKIPALIAESVSIKHLEKYPELIELSKQFS